MTSSIIIDFERTGGYAGLTLHTTIDSHFLPADETKELGRLIDEVRISELSQAYNSPESSPDQYIYKLKIQLGEEQHVFQLSEKQVPLSIQPLLKFLTIRSRYKKNNRSK